MVDDSPSPALSSADAVWDVLRDRGVRLLVDGDRLRVTAASGVLDSGLQAEIRRWKPELMARAVREAAEVVAPDAVPVHPRDGVPLTPGQERLWLFQQLDPASATYNLSPVVRLAGELDVERLRRALRQVVRRHEPLRTTIVQRPAGAMLVAASEPDVALDVVDVSHLAGEAQSAAVGAIVHRNQQRPFSLETEPPFRATLIRRSATRHDLVTTMHHIAVDGVSLRVLYRDLAAYYGGETPLPLPTSYGQFAVWQRSYWTPERLTARGEFWRSRLDGAPDELELPTDRSRGAMPSFTGAVVTHRLDATRYASAIAFAQSERATLFMLVLGAFSTVLHRFSGQRDLVVGTPLHGREGSAYGDLIGMFVNQLPLRMHVSPDATLRTMLRAARESALGSMVEHEMPFGALVEALGRPRDSARNPVFQALLNVTPPMMGADGLTADGVTFSLPELREMLALFDGQAKFDLTLYVLPLNGALELALVYNADLHDAGRMAALVADVGTLLQRGVDAPDAPLRALFDATPVADAATAAAPDTWPAALKRVDGTREGDSVPDRFSHLCTRFPDRIAVIGATRTLTYAELQHDAQRIARLIASARAADTSAVIGVMVPHGDESVPALMGALMSGCPYVPLDPNYPEARLRFMIQDAGVGVILTTAALRERAAAMLGEGGVVVDATDVPPDHAVLPPLPAPDALAYLLYTSGSTGAPKAVMQSHRNLLTQAHRYASTLSLGPDDRLAWLASISFDASLMDVFGGLVGGAAICPIDPRAIELALLPQRLADSQLSVLHVTPTVFRSLSRSALSPSFPTVRAVVLGGEAVRPEDIAFFDRVFAPDALLFNLYGASEHSFSLGYAIDRASRSLEVPIGWPVGDTEVLLLDDAGRPDAVRGEMVLRSAGNALGYWNAPAQTRHAFIADPEQAAAVVYRTGDLVRRRPDGAYVFVRRVDSQLKVRGHRIEAAEVESVLLAHPAIFEAAVHVVADTAGDAALICCYVLNRAMPSVTPADLASWLAVRLPAAMVPSGWVALDRLPRTPSGKIDRRLLPAPDPARGAMQASIDVRDAEEEEILGIWRDVLGMNRVGVTDDFFAMGGQSLTASQVVSRVREVFGVEFPLRQFFDHPTVEHAAAWVREHRGSGTRIPPLVPQEPEARTPLSFSQERLWFLQRLDPQGTAYNMAAAALLVGALDVQRLERAVHAVAMRQESLRTRFVMQRGQPAQVVEPIPFHAVDLLDLSTDADRSDAERLADARRLAATAMSAVYDLERDALFRLLVVRISPTQHLLAIGMHHTISDMWSYGVFARDLRLAYDGDDEGQSPVAVTYRDYARWQRGWLQGEALQAQVDYWRAQLAGVTTLELPTDFPRPAFFTFDGDIVRLALPAALRERIRALSVSQRATPFMVLLAAFKTLLAAYARQEDITVGVPIAGRGATATQNLVGSFVNTLVHRNRVSSGLSFLDLLGRVRATALDAFAHQDAPFEVLVRELQPARDTSRAPLFQVLFNVANTRTDAGTPGGLDMTVVPLDRRAAQFDLSVNVGLNDLESEVALAFNTNLFTRSTAERMLEQYLQLLDRATASPALSLAALQQASAVDTDRQLDRWNATARFVDATANVVSLFEASARAHATDVAVDSPTGSFTYAQLLEYAQRVSTGLRALGIAPGDRVAIVMERSREMLGALLGILGAGATYVPIDPKYPAARVRFMLDDSGVAALVTHRGFERQHPVDIPVLDLDRGLPTQPSAFVDVRDEDIAYVIYTSGSTGQPKGVAVTHRGVTNFLLAMRERPGMHAGDVLLAVTTISFDIAVLELYLPLLVGARVVIASESEAADGRQLVRRIDESGITVMQATPATWKLMLAAGWRGRGALRALCGGEALPSALAHTLLERTAELWNMYGPTETTVWSTVERIVPGEPILVGRPIANTTLYVLGSQRELLPIGVPGELYIGGAGVAAGYVNRPELTAERFIDSPFRPGERLYRTGDLVRYRHDGRVEHLGRLDSQVKVRGFRIELGEVEAVLRALTDVRDVVVTASEDRLVAFVVLEPHAHATGSQLRSAVAQQLPPHMVPAFLVMLDALPLTPNGKVDRKQLPDPAASVAVIDDHAALKGPRERAIAAVWSELLGVESIGSNSNFFEIGGHSLLAMEAVALLEERDGIRLEPRSLFFMTLQELAASEPPAAGT
jgi:amino acid adenylation domain-containing protein